MTSERIFSSFAGDGLLEAQSQPEAAHAGKRAPAKNIPVATFTSGLRKLNSDHFTLTDVSAPLVCRGRWMDVAYPDIG
jgi:hypothetical protein